MNKFLVYYRFKLREYEEEDFSEGRAVISKMKLSDLDDVENIEETIKDTFHTRPEFLIVVNIVHLKW